jgi:hypothetical protein
LAWFAARRQLAHVPDVAGAREPLIGLRHTTPITPNATTLLEQYSLQLCESRTNTHYLHNQPSALIPTRTKESTVPKSHFDNFIADIRKKASVRRVRNTLSILATSASALDTGKLWQDHVTSRQRLQHSNDRGQQFQSIADRHSN